MTNRKKPKKKRTLKPDLLSADEETLLASLLANPEKINLVHLKEQVRNPGIAEALVERLSPDSPKFLPLILAVKAEFPEKRVQKLINKTVFKLRKKGISIPEIENDRETPFFLKKREDVNPYAFVGPIDGTGTRAVFIVIPQIPKDVDLGIGIINDEQGILHFIYGRYSKKQMKEVRERFFERIDPMVKTSLSHAATILERAYSQNENTLGESSRDYLLFRPLIPENFPLLSRPVIYDYIPREGLADEILTHAKVDMLFGHDFMKSWIVEPDKLRNIIEEISTAADSPILISDDQKANRIDEIKEKAVAELFPDQKRLVMRNRLEEAAYIFYQEGMLDYARTALSIALSLEEKVSPLGVNIFLKAMIDRSIHYHQEGGSQGARSAANANQSSKIIIP